MSERRKLKKPSAEAEKMTMKSNISIEKYERKTQS
jgi:hypothetical protein